MKKVAIVLSGCGFLDGSEIYESVLTFLALDRAGVSYQCFAPDIPQSQVTNYLTGEAMSETRDVLVESARLTRGDVNDIQDADPSDFDAIIFPGGFGAALNLSDFATEGDKCQVIPQVSAFAKQFVEAKKPLGFICIAPTMIPRICGEGVTCTIGNDKATAAALERMGAHHEVCTATNSIVDPSHKVVSTPAYMLGKSIGEVAEGIEKLVAEIIKMGSR